MAILDFKGTSEVFDVSGEVLTLTYGSNVPTNVIDISQDWQVVFKLKTTGIGCSNVTGSWNCKVSLESLNTAGRGNIDNLGDAEIPLQTGYSSIEYGAWSIRIPARTVPEGIYRLLILVAHINHDGKRGDIFAFEEIILQCYRGDISPLELRTDLLSLRADTFKVLSALENSDSAWCSIDELIEKTGLSREKVKVSLDFLGEHVTKDMLSHLEGCERFTTRGRARRKLRQLEDLNVRTAAQNAILAGIAGDGTTTTDLDRTYDRIVGSAATIKQQQEINYTSIRKRADDLNRLSIIAGGVGITLIIIAVLALLSGYIPTAVVTTISSVVFGSSAGFFFKEASKANQRIDNIAKQLDFTNEILNLVTIADTITDSILRNETKMEIISKVLEIKTNDS